MNSSVVEYQGKSYCVVGIDIRESCGSCSYDRTYKLVPIETLKSKDYITDIDIEYVEITGLTLPFIRVPDQVPYFFEKEVRYKVIKAEVEHVVKYVKPKKI